MPKTTDEPLGTHFLNVDLDIISKTPLDPLVDAMGERVFVLHSGRWGRRYSAHFEWANSSVESRADHLIRRLVAAIERLPRRARRLWDRADVREFNIGIEAAAQSPLFELRVRPSTLTAVARLNGTIVATVYAPKRVPRPRAKKRKSTKSRLTSA